jgi:hypothetical protein
MAVHTAMYGQADMDFETYSDEETLRDQSQASFIQALVDREFWLNGVAPTVSNYGRFLADPQSWKDMGARGATAASNAMVQGTYAIPDLWYLAQMGAALQDPVYAQSIGLDMNNKAGWLDNFPSDRAARKGKETGNIWGADWFNTGPFVPDVEDPSWLPAGFMQGPKIASNVAKLLPDASSAARKITGGPLAQHSASSLKRLKDLGSFEEVGAYNDKVWKETGWFYDTQGRPNFWISDVDARLNKQAIQDRWDALPVKGDSNEIVVSLGDVLQHDKLYEMYPSLKDVKVRLWAAENPDGSLGIYNPAVDLGSRGHLSADARQTKIKHIQVNHAANDEQLLTTLMHEATHGAQALEGTPFGAGTLHKRIPELKQWVEEAFDVRARADAMRVARDNKDGGTSNVYQELLKLGYTEEQALSASSARGVYQILNLPDDLMHEADQAIGMMDASVRQRYGQFGYVLDFVEKSLAADGSAYKVGDVHDGLMEILNNTPQRDLEKFLYMAYENNLQEAVARLTEQSIGKIRASVPDPRNAPRVNPNMPMNENAAPPGPLGVEQGGGSGSVVAAEQIENSPVFDRGKGLTRDDGRGGTRGGSLDSGTRPSDAWKTNPEGTQQQGTLEELFGEVKPDTPWPQAHYTDFEGLLTPEMAADALLNPVAGAPNGAIREAARKLLFDDPMKYRTPDEVMDALERKTK